ncbi:MAG: nucleoid-associated protein [Bacteroidetes bacterium]|nr:MAG: nucleoid-associated protein [Bacteroidota bacterium]TAE71732.1 MAG: nucleoid-associated protein [Bacteroidota bacterium]TAF93408.1 MAG: nucleoid-associated protein [Bacteroidota bacterium]
MLEGIDGVELEKVIVHRVGNPSRSEQLVLSQNPLTLNDGDVKKLLSHYFLKTFNPHEWWQFTHTTHLQYNEVYNYCKQLFEQPQQLVTISAQIASFLYQQSTHSKVKEGELYVALLNKVLVNNQFYQAIGIFKSEQKDVFLKVFQHGKSFELASDEGIDIKKLDKGCLILNTQSADGYQVLVVDATNKTDAQYWVSQFLQVQPVATSYSQTNEHMHMLRNFITKTYPEKFEVSKTDQIDLLQKTMHYFAENDAFNAETFAQEVMQHPEVIETFQQHKQLYQQNTALPMEDEFDIHLAAVQRQSKVYKTVIKLDKNFHIYVHGNRQLIERGYDEFTGKSYYKIYFDEEK